MPDLPFPLPQKPLDNQQVDLYDVHGITNVYTFRPGVCILPLAEDPPTNQEELKTWSPVVKLQLHAPYRIRNVRYTNDKQNNPAIIPSPEDVGAFTFISGSVLVTTNANSTFCNYDWGVETNYVFVESCVSRVQDGLVLGSPPCTLGTTPVNATQTGIALPGNLIGAISQSGFDVLVGVNQGIAVNLNSPNGWGYNSPAYYPGLFFDKYLINGGYTPTPQANN